MQFLFSKIQHHLFNPKNLQPIHHYKTPTTKYRTSTKFLGHQTYLQRRPRTLPRCHSHTLHLPRTINVLPINLNLLPMLKRVIRPQMQSHQARELVQGSAGGPEAERVVVDCAAYEAYAGADHEG